MGKAPIGAGKSSWVLMSTIMPSHPYLTYGPVFSGGGAGCCRGIHHPKVSKCVDEHNWAAIQNKVTYFDVKSAQRR